MSAAEFWPLPNVSLRRYDRRFDWLVDIWRLRAISAGRRTAPRRRNFYDFEFCSITTNIPVSVSG